MQHGIKDRVEVKQKIDDRIEKIRKDIVPKGYKKTNVGIIPEDWEVNKLGEVLKVRHGKSQREVEKEDGQYPILATGGEIGRTDSFLYDKESVLIGRKGTIDRPVYMENPFWTIDTLFYTEIDENTDAKFLFYKFLNVNWYKYNEASGVPSLSARTIEGISESFPHLKEQQQIVSVLSTWGRAIELKKTLIKEKEKQKKGLMEKLLTPTKDWKPFKLGTVLFNRSETGYPELELIAVTGEWGVIKRDELDRKDTSSANKERYKLVKPNDIAYNTMRMWQGVSGISKYQGIVSPAYTVLEPNFNKIDPLFTAYLFKLESVINIFRRYSQGLVKDTLNLKYTNFSKINLQFPSLFEQKRIAKILSTADREIELLKQEVVQLKEQKKGLMQLLLTGIIRVKGDSDE